MSVTTIQQRYDEFQEQAVSSVVSDFKKKPNGRFLLVIPTGGGKTFTAVKAITRLFEEGVLDPKNDRVLWTAHRTELLTQARDTFEALAIRYPERLKVTTRVDFIMTGGAEAHVTATQAIKLAVIDEAHHAALKNTTYGPLFARKEMGILGLTATPSRHDGALLDFERESFSIGFPDLVKKGIVLKPDVRKVAGGTFDITDIDDQASLEQLNVSSRNKNIIDELLKHKNEYKKVIIYVGTVNHVTALYDQILKSPLKHHYSSISYITGNGNSRDQDRDAFVKEEKTYVRAIMVNVAVLTEGYDDPTVNTVVMAAPSRSKLYYMQAMGRAIRRNPDDELKTAFCVEIDDTLPNVRYRIDNRWLFSDVSDALEPAVIDRQFGTAEQFAEVLKDLYTIYGVPAIQQLAPNFDKDQRYTLLLFKRYLAPGHYTHFPKLIDNTNRLQVTNVFNYLSERMEAFHNKGIISDAAFRMGRINAFAVFPEENERRWVYDALTSAIQNIRSESASHFITEGSPWITFVALHFRQNDISDELMAFVSDVVNRDAILELLRCREFETGSYLIRLPLPLMSTIGRIVTETEYQSVNAIVESLRSLRCDKGHLDHRSDVRAILADTVLPIEIAHVDSLIQIARTDTVYSLRLS
jgi:superfamily II DNA or RNA helicase